MCEWFCNVHANEKNFLLTQNRPPGRISSADLSKTIFGATIAANDHPYVHLLGPTTEKTFIKNLIFYQIKYGYESFWVTLYKPVHFTHLPVRANSIDSLRLPTVTHFSTKFHSLCEALIHNVCVICL
jgi:hypothetical protein